MVKEIISTEDAPKAIGPYSQAVKVGNLVFSSGQVAISVETGELVSEGITEQTEQVMRNLNAVLEAAKCNFENVVKTTVFLADMDDFAEMNAVYEKSFGENKPARSTVEVARLPKDARVEIECVAIVA